MFELELLELLNNLKKTHDEYERNKIKSSIFTLISQNKEKYDIFIQNQGLDAKTLQFLNEVANQNPSQETSSEDKQDDDFSIIKKYYGKWLEIYTQNNKNITPENEKIIQELINFYVLNRFGVLEKILTIQDSLDYDAFKWHLKNQLRVYFGNKIKNYVESENYLKLSFLQKIKKKRVLNLIIDEIAKYKFDLKFMEVTLK